jgi:hypothetical protein
MGSSLDQRSLVIVKQRMNPGSISEEFWIFLAAAFEGETLGWEMGGPVSMSRSLFEASLDFDLQFRAFRIRFGESSRQDGDLGIEPSRIS